MTLDLNDKEYSPFEALFVCLPRGAPLPPDPPLSSHVYHAWACAEALNSDMLERAGSRLQASRQPGDGPLQHGRPALKFTPTEDFYSQS